MKKIVVSAFIIFTGFINAQEKEVKAAYSAVESNNMSTASEQLSAADAKLKGNLSSLTPEMQEQYYYSKGVMLLKNGKSAEGAAVLAKITDLGKSKIYSGKNSSKEKVYFVGKTAADASGISGLKEESYQPTTAQKLGAMINPILKRTSEEALAAYKAEKFQVAGDKFKEVYLLLKGAGQEDMQYLYNAGLSYAAANNMDAAGEVFTGLINSGYNGVNTTYSSKNKSTGEVATFSNKSTWELSKKDPNYGDFKTESSKSIESEIYEATVKVLINGKKYDEALVIIEKGLKKFPANDVLLEQRGIAYNATGKTSEFVTNLKNQIAKNPSDATSWYNLGVMQSKDPASKEEAKNAYIKALEIKPDMLTAHQNLTFLILGDDPKTIAEYETLKKAGKMEDANQVLKLRKARFAEALPYAEKWYAADPKNVDAVSLLKSFYQSAGNDAKFNEFKAKEKELSK